MILGVLFLAAAAPRFVPPAEDAAILFQYSDNLARTGVISYVAHGPRVEGATDFLWMVLLAVARLIRVSPHAATGPFNALALLGLGWLFADTAGVRNSLKAIGWTCLLLLLTPQMVAALSGFSVLPFGFLLVLLLWAFLRGKSWLLSLAALLLCLMRPDGVVFALPLLAFDLVRSRPVAGKLTKQLIGFYLPGLLYMAWRVHYFHHWFPLPFLVKSQAVRWLGLVVLESLEDISRYLALALLTIGLLWRWRVLRHRDTLALVVAGVVVPTLFYLTLRLDQNLADRFFFYLLLVPGFLLCMHRSHLARWRLWSRVVGVLTLVALLAWPDCFALVHLFTDRYLTNSLVAAELHTERLRGRMAVSEAGILAYESGWPTVDLWGLNSPEFSRHLVQPDDIDRLGVDLIVIRSANCRPPGADYVPSETRTWAHMAQNVLAGAVAGEYQEFVLPYNKSPLASSAERFTDGHQTYLCYFVRLGSKDQKALDGIVLQQGGVPTQAVAPSR